MSDLEEIKSMIQGMNSRLEAMESKKSSTAVNYLTEKDKPKEFPAFLKAKYKEILKGEEG